MFKNNLIKKQIFNLIKRILFFKHHITIINKKKSADFTTSIKSHIDIKTIEKDVFFNKKHLFSSKTIENINIIICNLNDLWDLLTLSMLENDNNFLLDIQSELIILEKKISQLEFNYMFDGKHDNFNCYLDIQAGSGGVEAQDWAHMLLRMYLKWADTKNFKSEIVSESIGEIVGIKSATLQINGYYAYGWLRTETGIHRLVRKSPFNSSKRRHTSFSSVFVYPEIANDIEINLNMSDVRFDFYRASGAGGQHVNRTESAVRITHLPTNIVSQCQSDRSQHRNKEQAIKQLKAKLYKYELQKKNCQKKILEDSKSDIGWGHQIRSYILDDSRIKDLRTGIEMHNVKEILNGNIDSFIKASLKFGL